jgi:hypothetical protein
MERERLPGNPKRKAPKVLARTLTSGKGEPFDGWGYVVFEDSFGQVASIQEDSVADYLPPGSSALWIGKDSDRIHLHLEGVKWLIAELQTWVDTCRLDAG